MDDKIFERFTITCDKCKGQNIEIEDSRGWSEISGSWGSIDFFCLDCGNTEEIAEVLDA